jgi:hypothetical protein
VALPAVFKRLAEKPLKPVFVILRVTSWIVCRWAEVRSTKSPEAARRKTSPRQTISNWIRSMMLDHFSSASSFSSFVVWSVTLEG